MNTWYAIETKKDEWSLCKILPRHTALIAESSREAVLFCSKEVVDQIVSALNRAEAGSQESVRNG